MGKKVSFAAAVPIGTWHPLLPAALSSLASQSQPLQIALLDASGDSRVAEAARSSGIDFAYYRTGPDAGQADAIAEGWRRTNGDVLFWLNADDRLRPEALTRAAAAFAADPDLAVFYGGSDFTDENGDVTGRHNQVADISPLLYRSNIISQPSCFARRDWVDRCGGIDAGLHYTMDWDLWMRLYAAGARFRRTEETLSDVYMGRGTKTAEINFSRLREIARLVRRHGSSWNALKATMAFTLHSLFDRNQHDH